MTISTERGEVGENGGDLVIFAKVAAFILTVNSILFAGNRDGRATKNPEGVFVIHRDYLNGVN